MSAPQVRYYEIFLELPTARSLKEKRGFLKGPLERIRKKLNLAIIEAAQLDQWTAATLAAVTLSTSVSVLDNTLRAALRELEESGGIIVKDWTEETL